MHVKKSLSQGLYVDLAQPGLDPGPSDPEAKRLPLDHSVTLYYIVDFAFKSDLYILSIIIDNYVHIV